MICEDVMTREVAVVSTTGTARDAARIMRDENVGFVPVCQADGSVQGTITDRDLALRVLAEDRQPDTRVEEIMSTGLVSCRPQDDLRRAEELMRTNQVNRILVIGDDGKLVGVISLTDVAQYEDERRVGALAADISGREADVH